MSYQTIWAQNCFFLASMAIHCYPLQFRKTIWPYQTKSYFYIYNPLGTVVTSLEFTMKQSAQFHQPLSYDYADVLLGLFSNLKWNEHYDDVIMSTMASQITSLTVVYSTIYSDADQRKHQTPVSLAFVWGIHRDRRIPRTKGQLRGKCFHLMTSSWGDQFTQWLNKWGDSVFHYAPPMYPD